MSSALVVSGDFSPSSATGVKQPLTATTGGRLRVEAQVFDATGAGTGAATMTTGQATLSTSASQVVAANANRRFVEVTNNDAAIRVFVGNTGVLTTTGHLLLPGAAMSFEKMQAAIFCVAASGSPVVSYTEY